MQQYYYSCVKNSHCVNTIGSFACECNEGFNTILSKNESNLIICEDIDECELKTVNCNQNSTCINTIGGFNCICDTGLVWSNELIQCIDINECDFKNMYSEPCDDNSVCQNTFGSYYCSCKTGWMQRDMIYCDGMFNYKDK